MRLEGSVDRAVTELRSALEGMSEAKRRLYDAHLDTIRRLTLAAEYKDKQTAGHIARVGEASAVLARAAGHSPGWSEMIRHAAPMHDVGKIGIPDEVLLKRGALTDAERSVMRSHTKIGADLLAGSDSEVIQMGATIALLHHEWWDGSGYPQGLAGEAIAVEARICAIIDFFDASTMARPFRPARPRAAVLEQMRSSSGTAFDPALLDAFFGPFPRSRGHATREDRSRRIVTLPVTARPISGRTMPSSLACVAALRAITHVGARSGSRNCGVPTARRVRPPDSRTVPSETFGSAGLSLVHTARNGGTPLSGHHRLARPPEVHRARRSSRLGRAAIAFAFCLAGLAPERATAQAEPSREYQVKAAFLFNFLQFVTWPEADCAGGDGPFVIGVLGVDPFGATLDQLVSGETMQNRPVVVERYDDVRDVGRCQMLFVSSSEADRLDAIFSAIAGRRVLTVGETPGFAETRGVIALGVSENRVRFEINAGVASGENLSISSRLLRLADVVRGGRS
jgi:hypothetical protein